MRLGDPVNLLALLVIPLVLSVAILDRRRRRRYAIRFPGAAVLASVVGGRRSWRAFMPPLLLALSAAALAVALARPTATGAEPVEKASVVLVMDHSGSMDADDVAPTRIAAARDAANRFLDRVPEELLVGFVGYSEAPQIVVEPTTEHDTIRQALGALDADGGTATGDALNVALDRLEARRGKDGQIAPAAIVLLSDGKTTAGSDPVTAARRAGRLKIPVYTVALGTPNGVVVAGPFQQAIPVPPDPGTLREMARASGGSAYRVEDAGELDSIYQRLGSRIGVRRVRREVSAAFAGAGLLLLIGALGTGLRWRGRVA
ncbi:MAG TPA: VWA domain-containing protein [Solirubrobacteraceae bacterium]|nr:VWA domain-containing protein [Solirubrobacteraceae bacterium]